MAAAARQFQIKARSTERDSHSPRNIYQHRHASSTPKGRFIPNVTPPGTVPGRQGPSPAGPNNSAAQPPSHRQPLMMPTDSTGDIVDVPIVRLADTKFRRPEPLYTTTEPSSKPYREVYYAFTPNPSWENTSDSYLAKLIRDVAESRRKLDSTDHATASQRNDPASQDSSSTISSSDSSTRNLNNNSGPTMSSDPSSQRRRVPQYEEQLRNLRFPRTKDGTKSASAGKAAASYEEYIRLITIGAVAWFVDWYFGIYEKLFPASARPVKRTRARGDLTVGSATAEVSDSKDVNDDTSQPQQRFDQVVAESLTKPISPSTRARVESLQELLRTDESRSPSTAVDAVIASPASATAAPQRQQEGTRTGLQRQRVTSSDDHKSQDGRSWISGFKFW